MGAITSADLAATLPDVVTTLQVAGMERPATIHRDGWGIPHIRAESEADLFFAQGVATAQDRLWQMDYDRMRCLGRWAEWAGTTELPSDRMMRRRGLAGAARADYDACSTAGRAMLDAFAAGVNAFLETTSRLPVEYRLLDAKPERWEPWHCVAVYKMRNTAEGSFLQKLFLGRLAATLGPTRAAALVPGYPRGHALTVPPGELYNGPALSGMAELATMAALLPPLREIGAGSNAWAVSGDRTVSGLPLVAGDSHRGLDTPNVYQQVHLACPEFDVIGQALPGFPGVLHFCHNQHVAWGMTYGSCDTQDLFVEETRVREGTVEYLFRNEWRAMQDGRETLRVRGARDETITVQRTHHGGVVAGEATKGRAITLADPGSATPTAWVDAARDAMRARSADELEGALAGWTDRVNNYVYADVHGEFGYALRGRVPVRPESNGWGPVPGWDGRHEWQGYIAPTDLPRSRNPERGYVVSCNQRIVDESYPYFLGHLWSPAYRAQRVTERLEALESTQIGVDEMAAIHGDSVSPMAQKLVAAVSGLETDDAAVSAAQGMLGEWDGRLSREAAAPLVYAALHGELDSAVLRGAYGPLAEGIISGADPGGIGHYARGVRAHVIEELAEGEGRFLAGATGTVLSGAIQRAMATLTAELGEDFATWRWGALHRTAHRHPLVTVFPEAALLLNPPTVAASGGGDTPLAGAFRLVGGYAVELASVVRYVHDPSAWGRSRWIVPLGASGHPGSLHYADQQETWGAVGTIPQQWEWSAIAEQAETAQRLEPQRS